VAKKSEIRLRLSTKKVEQGADGVSGVAARKGAIVMLTGDSRGRERVMLQRGGNLIPFDELSSNRNEAQFEPEVDGRETHVFIAGNEVSGYSFATGEIPPHIPFVKLLVPAPPESTFSKDGDDDVIALPGEGDDEVCQVVAHPSCDGRRYVIDDVSIPAIIGIRGTIQAVDIDPETGEEDVDVFVQLFPSTDEIIDLFRYQIKILISDDDRDEEYDTRTVLRARLESACRRLVNLFERGDVQVGATFEVYCAHAYVNGRCAVVVQDIKLNGNPRGQFRERTVDEDNQAAKMESGLVHQVTSFFKKIFRARKGTPQAVATRAVEQRPDPWQSFSAETELLSQAEGILYGDLIPALEEIWQRTIGHQPDVLSQLIKYPVNERPPSKARLQRDPGVPVGGRWLLRAYDGPSLFSDLPSEGKNIEVGAEE